MRSSVLARTTTEVERAHNATRKVERVREAMLQFVEASEKAYATRTPDDERARSTRLERMVGDFLDASRVEGGHLELIPERRDLRAIVRDAMELYRATARESGRHEILLSEPDDEVQVDVDAVRISQVLNNLLSNALKRASASLPPTSRASSSPSAAARRRATWRRASVSDSRCRAA